MLERLRLTIRPFANDPGRWGASLANNAEIMFPVLEAARVKSVGEVGAYAGDLTGLLLEWAAQRDGSVWAIDPLPQPELEDLARDRPDLELVRETSLEALRTIPLPDAVIIDGDHNYFTVTGELTAIAERASGPDMPLLLFHDVCWPHARRDDYYRPELVPEEERQPIVEGGGVFPGVEGVREGGLPYRWPAAREGGPKNGVLTAVEDFVASQPGLKLAVVTSFFGLGIVWHEDAEYAEDLERVVAPWDRNPLMERLEANRVLHLASSHVQLREAARFQAKAARQEEMLRRLLESSTFALAERLSAIRQGGTPAFSKAEIRRLLEEE